MKFPEVLRHNRPFRWFLAGQATSAVGDEVTRLAQPLTAVLALHANAVQMGTLVAVGLIPNLLFSLHAGKWIDEAKSRRAIMIGADVGRAALLGSIPIAFVLGHLTLVQLYVVAFLAGTLSIFFSVAYVSLFVTMVSRDDYVPANSLLNGSRAFSFIAGPSIGGFLVQAFTAPMAVLIDAISFIVSASTLIRARVVERAPEPSDGGIAMGIRFILKSSIVRSLLGATVTINLFNFIFFALFILYATKTLGVSPQVLGLVLGAGAVGGLIGSVITGRVVRLIGIGRTFILGTVLMPAPLVLVPLAHGPAELVAAFLFLAEFGSGLGVMLLDISFGTIFASAVPEGILARVSGAYRLANYGIRPVGALLGGFLGSILGLQATLWLASLGGLLGVAWLIFSPLVRMREVPESPPRLPGQAFT
jgi:MFS family permease